MADFVNADNTAFRSDPTYRGVINKIREDGVCPFCPENFSKYHKNPILKEGTHWSLTNNMYPYEGAKQHILILHKAHIENITDISPEAWTEFKMLLDTFIKETGLPGGTVIMRFGDTRYTGASVRHLHANLISPDGEAGDRKPIMTRVG
jgi:diadenosine tetraphosphate (Ap4A) HIT family hydrolase